MKKFLAFLLTASMAFTVLTGCGNPVYDDFENFLNVEMADVNENYDKIKAEAASWEGFEEDAQLEASLTDTLLPLVEASLLRLEEITPETPEVTEIKNKYIKVMEAYKEGFTDILAGIREQDEEKVDAGNERLTERMELLNEYNAALEALADEVGAEIEY